MRILQLTNNNIGAVAVDTLMPLGAVTRRYCCGTAGQNTFSVSTTGSITISINDRGYYKVTYSATLVAGAVGAVTLNLLVNGETVLTKSETATAVGDFVDITIPYVVRVLPCCPINPSALTIQVENDATSVAITDGTSNIIVEKIN
jgi:hypothetical protein